MIDVSPRKIDERVVEGITAMPYAHVTIKAAGGRGALTVLGERASEFPGVVQEPVSIRDYPYGEMAAQVLGYVGQVTEPELKMRPFQGVKQGTVVGQEGLEYYYDRYLRGCPASSASRSTPPVSRFRANSRRFRRRPVTACRRRSTSACRRRAKRRCWRGWNTRAPAANPRSPARSSRWIRATAKCSRSAPRRASTPTSSPNR